LRPHGKKKTEQNNSTKKKKGARFLGARGSFFFWGESRKKKPKRSRETKTPDREPHDDELKGRGGQKTEIKNHT